MARIHAPELEDFDWFPSPIRDALTDILRASNELFHLFDGAAAIVDELFAETEATRIVDLCSGGGGPVLALLGVLERRHGRRVSAVLTDKFPNQAAFDRAEAELPGRVRAVREPVDATALPDDLDGVRTLFNALHHFPPELARAIFADAARKRQPIASFEVVERSLQGAVMVSGVPLVTAVVTPFLRPRTFTRLALTYAVPLIPAIVAWDGFASCLRAYSPEELHALVAGLGDEGYAFRVVQRRSPFLPFRVTALIGAPVRR